MHYNVNDIRYNRDLETTCYFPYEQESTEYAAGTSGTYMSEKLMVNNQERENEPMSFTGVVVCLDGVLAFGDSRSTLKDEFGTSKKENDTTRKVFRKNDFIMTASGRNTIYVNGQKKDSRRLMTLLTYSAKQSDQQMEPIISGLVSRIMMK